MNGALDCFAAHPEHRWGARHGGDGLGGRGLTTETISLSVEADPGVYTIGVVAQDEGGPATVVVRCADGRESRLGPVVPRRPNPRSLFVWSVGRIDPTQCESQALEGDGEPVFGALPRPCDPANAPGSGCGCAAGICHNRDCEDSERCDPSTGACGEEPCENVACPGGLVSDPVQGNCTGPKRRRLPRR